MTFLATGFQQVDLSEDQGKLVRCLSDIRNHPFFRSVKEESFELLKISPGDIILEIGCGPLDDVHILAGRCNPGGLVIGSDISSSLVTLAKKASIVYAGDINPEAVILMVRNIARNRLTNVVPILSDAINLPDIIMHPADRIIMNLPLHSIPFLTAAFRMTRPGGTIHLYALVSREDEYIDTLRTFPAKNVEHRYVRSYSPDRFHVVYDIVRGDG